MNEVKSSGLNVECDVCKKKFKDYKLLIGVFCQDMHDGVIVGGKQRVFLCSDCFQKLDVSPTGTGVVTENGMTPLNVEIKK